MENKKLLNTREDCLSCVFYINSSTESKQIFELLYKLGFQDYRRLDRSGGYIRTDHSGTDINFDMDNSAWKRCVSDASKFTEYTFEQAMVAFGVRAPSSKMDNFVITPITEANRELVQAKLIRLGLKPQPENSHKGHTYYRKLGNQNCSWGDGNYWREKQPGATVISPKEFLSMGPDIVRPKLDISNLSEVQFSLPDKETQDEFLNRLFELGYKLNGGTELWDVYLEYWAIRDSKNIIGKHTEYTDKELIDYQLIINTNNTPLNTKTDGNKIIVCKPNPRVQRGERPESNGITGKKGRAAITSGHISYGRISG